MSNTNNKGIAMEELLRMYFNSSGFYVVRGANLKINGTDVTDIDLWLYNKSSSLTRERLNVDCKNKKSSQARERIIWTKGIQNIIKTDKCIVATRDKTPEIKAFGLQNGVIVMTGEFISNLFKSNLVKYSTQLTEEEFYNLITPKGVKVGSRNFEWKKILEELKSDLINDLSFSSINKLIHYAGIFLNECSIKSPLQNVALRSLYLVMSYLMIQIDYLQLEKPFSTDIERQVFYLEGIKYGKNGRKNFVQVSEMIGSLPVFKDGPNILYELDRNISKMNYKILSEYYSKLSFLKTAFEQAKHFDRLSKSKSLNELCFINKTLISTLYVMSDFHGIDRVNLPVSAKL